MSVVVRNARVLVVGAAGGFGAATARAFTDAGALVDGPARTELDMTDADGVVRFFEGRQPYNHVVIAAARTKSGPVADLALADAEAAMNSKFFGAYRIAKAAQVTDGGSITFVSGFLSKRPSAGAVLQGAINAALEALARGLALERAPVRVNAVSPGLVDTALYAGLSDADRQAMFAKAEARLPARRVGQPENIAQAILFVATNPYVTGSTVTVDGGGTIAA